MALYGEPRSWPAELVDVRNAALREALGMAPETGAGAAWARIRKSAAAILAGRRRTS